MSITFPAGSVREAVKVTYSPLPYVETSSIRLIKVFDLKAEAVSSGNPVTSFSKDLTLTLSYTDQDVAGLDTRTLRLYYFDETKARWIPLPSTVDKSARKVVATTNHFTIYGGGATPAYSIPGTVMDFQTNLSSGAAVSGYPIELPPGPGSFQPRLSLSYNSGSADEMKSNRDVGSWVGIGWNLQLNRVFYNEDEAKYFLEFNGASYELVQIADGTYRTLYYDEYWKVTKPSSDRFEMWDRDGTYYCFGGTVDSVQNRGTTKYRYDLRACYEPPVSKGAAR